MDLQFQNLVKSLTLLVCSEKECSMTEAINSKDKFAKIIERERARSDRNGHGFSVITYQIAPSDANNPSVQKLLKILPERMRITDEIGWFDNNHIGLLLYSSKMEDARSFACQVESAVASDNHTVPKYSILSYPSSSDWPGNNNDKKKTKSVKKEKEGLFNDIITTGQDFILTANQQIPTWKRVVDIVGSSIGLIILSPLFLLVGLYIKVVSPGPVFFKQERVGLGGKHFLFWKFRTMKVNVDTTAHQKLLADLIKSGVAPDSVDKPMTKLDHDPQIIPLGNILRKSCVDELPQLINVLRGEMSLIGPRPPIPYEVDEYDRWHKARLASVPGMTGLWQVSGKNRLTFKEMVRLDLRYLQKRSFLYDLKILFQTPKAIMVQVKDYL